MRYKRALSVLAVSATASILIVGGTQPADGLIDSAWTLTLLDRGLDLAASNGDAQPSGMSYMLATFLDADEALGDDIVFPDKEPSSSVYLASFSGDFSLQGASAPTGANLPAVKAVTLVVDAQTGQTVAWAGGALSRSLPDLGNPASCDLGYTDTHATARCSDGNVVEAALDDSGDVGTTSTACGFHCWNAVRTPLSNKGISSHLYIRCQRVIEWERDFLTHEMWVGANSDPTVGNWIEAGITKGINLSDDGGSDHQRSRYFWARNYIAANPDYIERYGDVAPYYTNINASITYSSVVGRWIITVGSLSGESWAIGPTAHHLQVGLEQLGPSGVAAGSVGATAYVGTDGLYHDGLPGASRYTFGTADRYFEFVSTGFWRFAISTDEYNFCD